MPGNGGSARHAHGNAAGTRALIDVLLLHRHVSHDHVVAEVAAALRAGALTADAVALEARLAAERESPGEPGPDTVLVRIASPVVSLTGAGWPRCPRTSGLCPRWPPTTSSFAR
ncbi:hypothetical protein ABZ214_02990 [Streptomyces iakyrus]|uniref:hypothetical protein n=1 Tax=Streptomyces iakyrus TaxID=68219 RepID=UPI0033B9DDAC